METIVFPEEGEDWQFLLTFLPPGWKEKAQELGAVRRYRRFENPEALLRTLLIHLVTGCSLRETVARAKQGRITQISDVALLKRLKAAGEWLRWMAQSVMQIWVAKQPKAIFGEELRIRIIDGSTIQEPGSTGTNWRLHYSVLLPTLQCNEVHVTSPKIGESFQRYLVQPGDLFLGDRGYARREAISYVLQGGGQVLVRTGLTSLPLMIASGIRFPLLEQLRTLTGTELGDWDVCMPHEDRLIPGRICALKKNKIATEKARRKVMEASRKGGYSASPESLEAAAYIFVFTTLTRDKFKPAKILEMYRGRWQVELAFKRLKSLLGLGHLKKTDEEVAKAWLQGKLLVAFLIEALIASAESFFPWGYPIPTETQQMSMERNLVYGSSR
jgi:hypothetical protein